MIKLGRKSHFTIAAQNQNFRKKRRKRLLTSTYRCTEVEIPGRRVIDVFWQILLKEVLGLLGGFKFLANYFEGGIGVVGKYREVPIFVFAAFL
jgi:hypothetical protein